MNQWNYEKALQLKIGDKIQWRHKKYNVLIAQYEETKLLKTLTISNIHNEIIRTNFGSYDLKTGKNCFEACGCKRFCDCYGSLVMKDA